MSEPVGTFISRWKPSGGSEMANFQTFANELTDLLGVARPKVSDVDGDYRDHRFERPMAFTRTGRNNRGRIDLHRKGCFIPEVRQGGNPMTRDEVPDPDARIQVLDSRKPKPATRPHLPPSDRRGSSTMTAIRPEGDRT